MKCPKCFNEIPEESKMCPICQNIFATFFEEIKLTPKQKLKLFLHRTLFPIIAITILILLLSIKYISYKTKMNRITDVNNLVQDKTQKSYINDLYISDERHYKYLLKIEEQELYNEIIDSIKNYKTEIQISSEITTEQIKQIKQTISMDHPELINLGYITAIKNYDEQKLYITYVLKEDEYKQIEEQLQTIINIINKNTETFTEYEKIKYVYNYLKENTKKTTSKDPISYSASCILKECNSEGYAKLSQIIFQNIKINSILATGNINTKYHEWNIVKIDNKYYYYDQTATKYISNKGEYDLYNKKLMPKINGKKYAK